MARLTRGEGGNGGAARFEALAPNIAQKQRAHLGRHADRSRRINLLDVMLTVVKLLYGSKCTVI